MSGIVGVFALDGRPVASSEIRKMSAAVRRPLDGEDIWVCSSFGLGFQYVRVTPESLAEQQPLVSSSGIAVCFDGRLDNRQELARGLLSRASQIDATASDAAFVLAAYEQLGDRFVAELNGDFAIALFDPGRRQLVLARDVMATRCLYYSPQPGALLFASEIKCLLADPRVSASPDEDGLAEAVLDYWTDVRRTCFKGIFSVQPGHLVVFTPGKIEVREHWSFDVARQVRFRSFDDYRDGFRLLFEQSVRRRLRSAGPVAVSVSGGVDSSSIFCTAATLIRRESLPIALRGIALTFPTGTPAHETGFLDELERVYNVPIERIPVARVQFLSGADALVRQLEIPGFAAQTEAAIFRQARQAGGRVVLSGFFGDQMLADRSYLVDLFRRGRWLKVRHDLREFAAWFSDAEPGFFARDFLSALVRALPPRWLFQFVKRRTRRWRGNRRYPPWFTQAFRDRAVGRASTRFETAPRFPTAHAEQYYRHATTGHYANSIHCERSAGLMHGLDVRYPFRDRDLVAFLMAIPGDVVNRGGVPKALIREALSGVLPDAIRDRRSKADFTVLVYDGIRESRRDLACVLAGDCLAVRAGFVDGDVLRCSLATMDDRDGGLPGWHLTDVIGLELWLRNFFGAPARVG